MSDSDAILSPCGTYRYVLWRRIPSTLRWVRPCVIIGLNPSTADATLDDPTIRRCKAFAKAWECTELIVVNLFALRATDPAALYGHPDPIGPQNDRAIAIVHEANAISGVVVAAWGAHPMADLRGPEFRHDCGVPMQCLGYTKSGAPRHPLYVRADAQLVPWPKPAYSAPLGQEPSAGSSTMSTV